MFVSLNLLLFISSDFRRIFGVFLSDIRLCLKEQTMSKKRL